MHNQPLEFAGEADVLTDEDRVLAALGMSKVERSADEVPSMLPVLPVRNTVLFPGMIVPLTIGRESSRKLLDEGLIKSKKIAVFTQRNPEENKVTQEKLFDVGVMATVLKQIRQSEDQVVIVVEATHRIKIRHVLANEPYMVADVQLLVSSNALAGIGKRAWKATVKNLKESALKLIELSPDMPEQVRIAILNIAEPDHLADFLAGSLSLDTHQRQEILEELDVVRRVKLVQGHVSALVEIAKIQQKIQKDVASQFNDAQKRAFLREQIRVIHKELGEGEEEPAEVVTQLRERLIKASLPPKAMEEAERELKRLKIIPSASPEYSVIVSYLEILAGLPWEKRSQDNLDLKRAQQTLDRDHYGLEKVKRRLVEYLAVRKLNPGGRGPILCFLGPPGVGKTSLGQSVADALGRKFCRLSLGGMRDEAEIRGHRRTYIGSMPGAIMMEMRRCGMANPVFMLDEIDKVGADFRGDPASALLEVLDPRQNQAFVDRYLDVPFDLSQVLFIATANYMDTVPPALKDRMEVIEMSGYTLREKLSIATRYLVRRQLKENGLVKSQCLFEKEAIEKIIESYTHEAGVRELERQIGAVCRYVAARVAKRQKGFARINSEEVHKILGPAKFIQEKKLSKDSPGVVTGLAWTPSGGEVLHIEALRYPGKGGIMLTGQIGDVMKESAHAALSLVRSRLEKLSIAADAFKDTDLHVHVPSGAVAKDGPSAGIAMFTAIASLFSGIPVNSNVAMTGEVTLRGLVLPIGGLKEKALAATRAGIGTIIIPRLNQKDLPDIPVEVRRKIKIILVENVDEVLAAALQYPPDKTKGRDKKQKRRILNK